MNKKPQEWFKQAEYDMETAMCMYDAGRYFYAIFICHLSIEKALKGVYVKVFDAPPPRTHNLVYLNEKISFGGYGGLPENMERFVNLLNLESVATRYPEDIERSMRDYTKERTLQVITNCKEVLQWLKTR